MLSDEKVVSTFVSRGRVDSPRVACIEEAGFLHTLVVPARDALDAEVQAWIRERYRAHEYIGALSEAAVVSS